MSSVFNYIVYYLFDGFFIWGSKGLRFYNYSLAIMYYITFVKKSKEEILVTTKETRDNLFGFQNALRHVHVEI